MKKEKTIQEFNNIKELIYNSAKIYENNIAFIVKHQEGKNKTYENITYKMLLEQINALGTKLYDMELKNKRIAILGRNRYEWALGHLTSLLGGIVSIPLDKDLQIDELENSLIRSKADAIYFDEKYIEKIEEIKSRNTTNVKQYICMSKIVFFVLSLFLFILNAIWVIVKPIAPQIIATLIGYIPTNTPFRIWTFSGLMKYINANVQPPNINDVK